MEQNNCAILNLPIEELEPNKNQPRLVFDEFLLNDLAESIKTHGIIQPLVVRKTDNKYEIISGERRFRAAKIAGIVVVPAVLTELNEKESAEIAVVENIQRKALNPIEEAKSYKVLLEKGLMTQEELAQRMGVSQSAIASKLWLLKLNEPAQNALLNNEISERHARSLLKLPNEEELNKYLEKVVTERLTVRQLELEIKDIAVNNQVKSVDLTSLSDFGLKKKSAKTFKSPIKKNLIQESELFSNKLENESANMNFIPIEEEEKEEEIDILDDVNPLVEEIFSELNAHEGINIEIIKIKSGHMIKVKIPKL